MNLFASTPANVGTEITSAAGATSYAGVKLLVGWQSSTRPDAALNVEVRSGVGALTGGGTLHASGSLPASALASASSVVTVIAFTTAFSSAAGATQYMVRFSTTASSGKGWKIPVLDVRSDVVSGTTAAEVQGASQGGTTDSFFTGGTEDDRYDIPVALVASPTPLSGLVATAVAGT